MPVLDQDRIRYTGTASAASVSGSTPFGFFDSDPIFQVECAGATKLAALRLGYPNIDVELINLQFFALYEEASNEYFAQVHAYNIRNNIMVYQGQNINSIGNASYVNVQSFPLPYVVQLANGYGSETGTGGNITWKQGHITTTPYQQLYDLQDLWGNPSESFDRIDIKRIFHQIPPAFARIYDPFSMTGMSYSNILNEMGFSAYSPAIQFLMTPIFEDLLRGQGIKFNDMVRKSQYSFELINNKLKLFPIPTYVFNVYFEYSCARDRFSGSLSAPLTGSNSIVTDFSNVPYQNPIFSTLNSTGKQWIRKYFLALCKETLGSIRSKYMSIPIPNGELTMDGSDLRSEASKEKEDLINLLKEHLEESGKFKQMEKTAQQAEEMNKILKTVPLFLYIG